MQAERSSKVLLLNCYYRKLRRKSRKKMAPLTRNRNRSRVRLPLHQTIRVGGMAFGMEFCDTQWQKTAVAHDCIMYDF